MAGAVAAALFALALAGCGGGGDDGGIASAGGTAAPAAGASPSASKDNYQAMLEFTECMRGEGIQMEDPEPGGGVQLRLRGGDPAKTEAAMAKCRHLMPNGGEMPKADPERIEKARQYSKCMRENGVPNFPDPDPETGNLMLRAGPDSGLDPNSAAFQAAQKTCEKLRPVPPGSGS
ncbi:hypothetical protein RB614_17055 [Phytohabitans sp. ZYX-F-186]|uniref:Lipoprotein n=1 Tax=Phytohabitans maris TaxID=3071409 RepID=A0ABU0ZGN3_9ACTN|nr:hypothetical protein [Phytohabitans sp. ZYX-F-186]MDQ7906223.1 hypothetical protein [Phytohabitans sp. ZYX-F-186]